MSRVEHILNYLKIVRASNKEYTKKEAFKDLLNRLYSTSEEIKQIIDKMTLGAEATVFNIPRTDRLHRGSADTLYNNIIIEFENNLRQSINHAKEQLAGYLLGKFNTGEGYNFTLIASDFINWKVFAPDISCLDNLENLLESELILNEVESASFVLDESNCEDFYYWIDRFLFKKEKQKATLKSIEEAFGFYGNTFIESYRELNKWFFEAKKYGTVQVPFEQWHKFLSIAYGSFEAREEVFLIHTYLSIFAKMLAYSVVSNDEYIDDNEMKKILDGSIFNNYNIANFVENDFFNWVCDDRNYKHLKKVFRVISQEISVFDITSVEEDILKGVYQDLIDIDTRHSLGEYYTPDWLCERIVNEFEFKKTDKILDPSCGSGSFLRAIIHRLYKLYSGSSVEDINQQVFGIDIHPLSVQISKTNLLIAFGEGISKAKKPLHLNVYLANTLLAPEGMDDLFGTEFPLNIDKDKYFINTQVLDDIEVFDNVLDFCEELSKQTAFKKNIDIKDFEIMLKKQILNNGFNSQIIESFYKIYLGLKKVKEKGRDSIWKFIIANLYKPYFLSKKFNYVIGNPPWFTFSSIRNEEYQNILEKLATKYEVKPKKIANYPHLEIAAIFQAYCSSYFLKDEGRIAFVLPRSILSADHHDNTRSGVARGFQILRIWDLSEVSPLFKIPSCVFFSEKSENGRKVSEKGLIGLKFQGKLPYNDCHLDVAEKYLKEEEVTFYYSVRGNSSAFTTRKSSANRNINPYKLKFKQGATIVPRAFYFVELAQKYPDDFEDRILNIKTSKYVLADGKAPWKGLNFSDWMESRFLFRTALSKSILPFGLYKPDMVVLPVLIETDDNKNKSIKLKSAEELMKMGYLNASRWFFNAERIWELKKTEKNKNYSFEKYLNWHNKLTSQNLNKRYLVLYNSSAKDANALVVDRKEIELEFIVESKTYVFFTDSINEAYYLSAFLNSSILNLMVKDFQTRGLFGPRDIHKKILDIYFPSFDSQVKSHIKLAELGRVCHKKATNYLEKNPPNTELAPLFLGRLRLQIKELLSKEIKEIDRLVQNLIK